MEPERTSIIEAIAVVDIDPSLAVYCPECKQLANLVRIKMAYQSGISFITSTRKK